jgi:hypothetical protein
MGVEGSTQKVEDGADAERLVIDERADLLLVPLPPSLRVQTEETAASHRAANLRAPAAASLRIDSSSLESVRDPAAVRR